jgi:hypothetical protein
MNYPSLELAKMSFITFSNVFRTSFEENSTEHELFYNKMIEMQKK